VSDQGLKVEDGKPCSAVREERACMVHTASKARMLGTALKAAGTRIVVRIPASLA
jgi:hypothetical protein